MTTLIQVVTMYLFKIKNNKFEDGFMKLSKIGDMKMGLVLSRKVYEKGQDEKHIYKAITLASTVSDGTIDVNKLDNYSAAKPVNERYLTNENDVLIRLSEPNTALFIDKSLSGLVVPSQFVIVKVRLNEVLPEFLAWVMNSPQVKKQLEQYKNGSSLKTINTGELGEIKINILSLSEQEKIIGINRLYLRETELLSRYKENRESLYKGVMNKIYGGIKL